MARTKKSAPAYSTPRAQDGSYSVVIDGAPLLIGQFDTDQLAKKAATFIVGGMAFRARLAFSTRALEKLVVKDFPDTVGFYVALPFLQQGGRKGFVCIEAFDRADLAQSTITRIRAGYDEAKRESVVYNHTITAFLAEEI